MRSRITELTNDQPKKRLDLISGPDLEEAKNNTNNLRIIAPIMELLEANIEHKMAEMDKYLEPQEDESGEGAAKKLSVVELDHHWVDKWHQAQEQLVGFTQNAATIAQSFQEITNLKLN